MVKSWKTLYREAEAQAVDAQVERNIGGHSARRSGAKTLSRCGWEIWKTQFHGRWGSDAIKAYTEEIFAEVAETWKLEAA